MENIRFCYVQLCNIMTSGNLKVSVGSHYQDFFDDQIYGATFARRSNVVPYESS